MAIVDYAEWFRQEMQRRGMGGMPGAVGSRIAPGTYQGGYKPEKWSEQRKEMIRTGTETLSGAAQGASVGSVVPGVGTAIGAAVGAGLGAARGMAKEAKEGVKAFKEGDSKSLSRNPWLYTNPYTAPLAVWSNVRRGIGLSKDWDPLDWAARGGKELFGGPQTRIEEKRWDRLKDYGFQVPKWAQGDRSKKFDVYRKDLPPDFVGYDKDGNWVNNKFARTRNEADLTATDISQSAAMYENFGKVYEAASQQAKDAMAALALQNNLIQEQKGTLNIAWNDELYQKAADILMQDKQAQEYMATQPKEYVSPFVFNEQTQRFEDTRTQPK